MESATQIESTLANLNAAQTSLELALLHQQNFTVLIGIIVTAVLTVSGWVLSVYLQNKNVKEQQKAQINYDIYKELVIAHKSLQKALAKFSAVINPPLILMESELVPWELSNQLAENSVFKHVTLDECIEKGMLRYKKWLHDDFYPKYFNYQEELGKFGYLMSDWSAPLSSIETASKNLRTSIKETNSVFEETNKRLYNFPQKNGTDWRKWNKHEIEQIVDVATKEAHVLGSYISDYMVLAHNELLSPYYRYHREMRKTYGEDYKVLTKDGFETRIETDPKIIAEIERELNKIQGSV